MFLCLVIILIIGGIFVVTYRNNTDYAFVDRNFLKIQLPPELHLIDKQWNDYTKDDASLASMWQYNYSANKNEDMQTMKQRIESSFSKQNLSIYENNDQSPGEFLLSAGNKKVTIYIVIDYNSSTGMLDPDSPVNMSVRRT